jgi:NTP pyrophosphatase (non-canonical NTP hydrolase)
MAFVVDLQHQLHEWRQQNFPEAEEDQQLLGIIEELGELAHANLKRKQGIRGAEEIHEGEEMDAIGDLMIYLCGYCSYRGWDLEKLFGTTAQTVMKRNWNRYPFDGAHK